VSAFVQPVGAGWLVDSPGVVDSAWRLAVPADAAAELSRAAAPACLREPPLTGLAAASALSAEVLRRLRDGPGFVLLTGLPVDDEQTAADLLWAFGRTLGRGVPQSLDGALVGRVEDAGADLHNPHHRGHKTNASLPFHVDRTDVIALLCIRNAAAGGESRLVSAPAVHDVLLRENPEALRELYVPLPHDRRGEQRPSEQPWCQIPVFARVGDRLITRYVRRFVEATQRHPDAPRLTEQQVAALDALDEVLTRPEVVLEMDLRPGDLQVIDNFSILHARSAFRDDRADDGVGGRLLLRLWLSTTHSPRLPKSYAPIYGSVAAGTVRGGVWPEGMAGVVGEPVGAVR